MKNKTALSLLCLCVLSVGLFHRQNPIQANLSPAQQVGATSNQSKEGSPVEQLLTKTQQANVWEQAIQLNPQDAEAHHQLGLVLGDQNQVEEAISHYQQAIALKPANVSRIYQSWGKALVKQNQIDDAIATFRQGITQGYPDAPTAMQEAEVHFRLGLALEAEGRLPAAIKAYRQAIVEKPDRIIYEYLGTALVKHNRLNEALVAFKERWSTSYEQGLDYQKLGDALVHENRPEDALAAYRQWIGSSRRGIDTDADAYLVLGNRLSLFSRVDQAKSAYQNALDLTDGNQSYIAKSFIQTLIHHNQLGEAKLISQKYFLSDLPFQKGYAKHLIKQSQKLIKANQLDQAANNCREAAQILNSSKLPTGEDKRSIADIWSCLGQVHTRQGRLEQALASFRQEYKLNKYAYTDIAETLVKLQRSEEALDVLRQDSSQEQHAYTQMGRLLIAHQQAPAGAQYCQKALGLDAQDLGAYRCLAKAVGSSKQVEVNVKQFQKRVQDLSPKLIQQAYRANRLGNDTIGYTLHEDAIGIKSDEVYRAQHTMPSLAKLNVFHDWGDILVQQGKPQEAIAAYHQTLRLLPEYAPYYDNLGAVLMQQQQYGGAIAAYRRAVQLDPYEAQSYVNLSKALQAVGQTETAALALQQAVQLGWQETSQGS
ncbi:tetratricopeptide repeat protein [Acaryochloris sp. IP29b_bin.137]|uniref:tetratricopeptide repeat protein n=1 Tax=Acaryochloris sp. IP29b_bin.137 TaxID=2969217 RepID=UPI002636ACC5|nr:tetratricopeptide repeat protein [Acaryochloris sp. IP29b_bin.137]